MDLIFWLVAVAIIIAVVNKAGWNRAKLSKGQSASAFSTILVLLVVFFVIWLLAQFAQPH